MSRQVFNKKSMYNQLTQGSIINCCTAEEYEDREVWGCIITPRCDLARDMKVPTIHYLPIVKFEDWLEVFLKPQVLLEWEKNKKEEIEKFLENNKLPKDLYNRQMSDELFKQSVFATVKRPDKQKQFEDLYLDVNSKNGQSFRKYIARKNGQGIIKNAINNLIKNSLRQFYLIESWSSGTGSSCMIIILRDVRKILKSHALAISKGIEEEELFKINDRLNDDLSYTDKHTNLYWIESEIKSPFIEHILEAFSYNFVRIGVDDLDKEKVNTELLNVGLNFFNNLEI